MPKIINAFADDDSLAKSLTGLATSMFGGNQAQQEVYRQTARGKMRENENLPLAADALSTGNVADAVRYGVMGGLKGQDAAAYNLLGTSGRATSITDPALSRAYVGAGHSAAGSPWGVTAGHANSREIARMTADRQLAGIRYTADNTPRVAVDPETGGHYYSSNSQAIQQGLPAPTTLDQQRGAAASRIIPTLPADDQRRVIGLDKNPGQLWTYEDATGAQGTTANGETDVTSGRRLQGPIKTIKLEGANADGLSPTMERQRTDSIIATRTALADIDSLITVLQQPNADQAVGYLGTLANTFNNMRSQFEATSRLLGAPDKSQTFIDGSSEQSAVAAVTDGILRNPAIIQKAASMGLDHAIINSQVQDLAYTIAKAKDPGGRVSNDDIKRAGQIIGAAIQDPSVAVPVLNNLKGSIQRSHEIREQVYNERHPRSRTGTPAAGAPAAGAAAPTAGAPPVDFSVYFGAQ